MRGTVVVDIEAVQGILRQLRDEYQKAKAELEKYQTLEASLRDAITAMAALVPSESGESQSEGNGSSPRGIEAIRLVLQQQPTPMTVRQITDELQMRGWIREDAKAPVEATRVALRRLRDRDTNVKEVKRGRYAYIRR